jgi:YHS domain-containing protein
MKKIILLVLIAFSTSTFAQENYYTKKGAIAEGYDVVAYFSNKAVEGNKKFAAKYNGVKFYFSSQKNLDAFNANPTNYIPQYGGFCSYAMASKGKKVTSDPETFEVREGKLYLFYNSWGTNTFKSWVKEGPKQLIVKADKNWTKITQK